MNFKTLKKISLYLSKDYSEQIFRLLLNYKDLSASEAASRLNLHIKTVQDFLEAMSESELINSFEVNEGKRPYKRYSLTRTLIKLEYDLSSIIKDLTDKTQLEIKIRENKNARVRFNLSRNKKSFSSVVVWIGKGRSRQERKINLTTAQGKFLYNLPFPTADHVTVTALMKISGIEDSYKKEIDDIISVLIDLNVIDVFNE